MNTDAYIHCAYASNERDAAVKVLVSLGVKKLDAIRAWDPFHLRQFHNIETYIAVKDAHPNTIARKAAHEILWGHTWNEWVNHHWYRAASTSEKLRIGRWISFKIFNRKFIDNTTPV